MMSPSLGLPSSYSAQMGMMFGLDQPNQFQPTMPPMTNQQQQSSSNPPGKPQNTIPNQHTGTAALQAMNPFNPTSGISQSSDFAGNVPNQQSNRYNLTSQHQQTQVSFGVPAVMSDQSSRVQSLMTSNSAAASSPSHNQQPSLTGLTGMAPSPQTKAGATMMPGYGQSIRPPMNFGPAQGNFYGNQSLSPAKAFSASLPRGPFSTFYLTFLFSYNGFHLLHGSFMGANEHCTGMGIVFGAANAREPSPPTSESFCASTETVAFEAKLPNVNESTGL